MKCPSVGACLPPGPCGRTATFILPTTADLVGSSICDQAAITGVACAALPVTSAWITCACP